MSACIWNYMRATGKPPCGAPLTGPVKTHGYWCAAHKDRAQTAWVLDLSLDYNKPKKPAPEVIEVLESYL